MQKVAIAFYKFLQRLLEPRNEMRLMGAPKSDPIGNPLQT